MRVHDRAAHSHNGHICHWRYNLRPFQDPVFHLLSYCTGNAISFAHSHAGDNGYSKVVKFPTSEAQLDTLIDRYQPEIAALARACLRKMCARLPGATQLVYDNYNALAIGFGPSEKTSHAIFSIVLYPRWVTLFFLQGARLADPQKLLKGNGRVVRHIVLKSAADLDQTAIQSFIGAALKEAVEPIDAKLPGGLIIKSISAKQRPRLPVGKKS
jgi:hypothetical protein